MSNPAGFFQLRISVDGVEVVNRKFAGLRDRLDDLSPAWQQVGAELRADFALNMLSEGGRYGGWAPLAPATIAEKARHWPGRLMEERTGTLLQSLGVQGALGNVTRVEKMSASFGTELYYAGFQHFGTRRGLPARALVGLSWYTRSKVVAVVGDYIRESIRAEGLE